MADVAAQTVVKRQYNMDFNVLAPTVPKRRWETLSVLRDQSNESAGTKNYTKPKSAPTGDSMCSNSANKVQCFNDKLEMLVFWSKLSSIRGQRLF